MGLFSKLNPFDKPKDAPQRSVLDEAADGAPDDMLSRMVETLLNVGIDGKGPLISAAQAADKALKKTGSTDKAIDRIIRDQARVAASGGFLTGLGGFITLPVAIPVNVVEFYVAATRMVAGIAHLRGYDFTRPEVRTAILLTLTGSKNDDILSKVGINPVTGRVTSMALEKLPKTALMMVNKAVAFRLMKNFSEKLLAKLGKFVPVAGGFVGGGLDYVLLKRIASNAKKELPQVKNSRL